MDAENLTSSRGQIQDTPGKQAVEEDSGNNTQDNAREEEELHAYAETMRDIAKFVSSGKCILFLGAGVHCSPPPGTNYEYPDNERPESGSELSARLAGKTDFARRYPNEGIANLQRVSQDFETKKGRAELIREIKNAVYKDKKPSPVLKQLAKLDFPLAITTNYDQLFEDALLAEDKHPFTSVYKKNEDRDEPTDDYAFDEDPSVKRPFVFKMHGDIIKGPDSIVITDEDYIQFVLRMSDKLEYHPIPETFRFHFKRWPTLFIGYSLKDYNLRLLFKTLRWKIDKAGFPPAYSVDLYPDPLVFDVWFQQRRYIIFLVQGVWTFVPDLYRRVKGP